MQTLKCFQLNRPTSAQKGQSANDKLIRLVQEAINQSPKRRRIIQIIEALERRSMVPDVELYVEEE